MNDAHNMATAAAHASAPVAAASAKHTFIAVGAGMTMATIVVMAMTMPKNRCEFFVALLSTVASSIFGGAWVIQYLGIIFYMAGVGNELELFLFLGKLGGIFFVCGLPGWIVIRACFLFSERRRDKDILQIAEEVKDAL
jgi:lipid-A-disaccharide synthase-like uncharacterized protein